MTDARGNTTSYAYGFDDQPTVITYADGSSVIHVYDAWGRRISTTNELGNTWTYAHDEFGRVIAATDPLGRTTRYSYAIGPAACGSCHADDKPTQITLPSGKIVKIDYDNEWRKVSETIGFGSGEAATTLYGYDSGNRLVTVTDPRGKVTTYTYDARNRRLSATDPLGDKTEWIHNDAAHTLTEKRPDGGLTVTQYDVMDRVATTTDPKGQTTQFAYGGTGAQGSKGDNLVTLSDARGNSYRFTYDLQNRKTAMIYPDNSQESWAFDGFGNMITYSTRAGQAMTCTYDNRNRDTFCDWSDATPDVTKTYNAAGRVLTMNSSVSHLRYTYDLANQLTSETQDINNPVNLQARVVSYSYDADGNRASLIYPDGSSVSYGYTARNQLASVTADEPPPLATYTYDLGGRRTLTALENGTSAVYGYDDAGRLLLIDHRRGAASFARYDYGYNTVGSRTYRTETVGAGVPKSDVHGYDATDQLTSVRYGVADPQTPQNPERSVTYAFDAAGNRTSLSDSIVSGGASMPYSANNLNQYTLIDALAPLSYDQNGNLTRVQYELDEPLWTYSYDAQNRLTSVTGSDGTLATFAYDPRNRCIYRSITAGGDTSTLLFYWDDWNLLCERTPTDAQLARYVHGAVIDELLARITPHTASYYHRDALGSAVALTDPQGTMIERYAYDVYGKPTVFDSAAQSITISLAGNRFLFTGREWMHEVGVYDFRRRAYTPTLGRFAQTDPIRFLSRDVNLYRYVSNNGPSRLDPYGLAPNTPVVMPMPPSMPYYPPAPPCDIDGIYDNALELEAKYMGAGHGAYSGAFAHCVFHCEMRRNCPFGLLPVWGHNFIEWVTGADPDHADWSSDIDANNTGAAAASGSRSCACECSEHYPTTSDEYDPCCEDWAATH